MSKPNWLPTAMRRASRSHCSAILVARRVLVDQIHQDVVGQIQDVFSLVGALEQIAADGIDRFPLLVHDIVVFQQVFADLEVAGFHLFLGSFDLARDQLALDGNAFLHPQRLHDSRDAIAGEDAHEIVFQREIEARRSRISLAPGAAAQLIVDAPRLVPFRAEDVQSAERDDLVMLFLADRQPVLADAIVFLLGDRFRSQALLAQSSAASGIQDCRPAGCRCRGRPCWSRS